MSAILFVLSATFVIVEEYCMLSKSGKVLLLEESMTLTEIQQEFSCLFPFLKLEFYSIRNTLKSTFNANLLSKRLVDFRKRSRMDDLNISPDMSVNALENTFEEMFDLDVHVYRKSGRSWLETSATGEWTLSEQNAEGEALGE
jgi:hypothetical protein